MTEHARTAAWVALFLLGVVLSAVQLGHDEPHHHRVHTGHGHGHEHGDQQKPQRLFSWEAEQAQTLMLAASDGREYVFTRTTGGWKSGAAGPPATVFDPQTYLALLSQARKDREFDVETGALPGFGLQPALVHVRVQDAAGNFLADLSVGTRTPDGFGRYVSTPAGTKVLIVPNYQFDAVLEAVGLGS